MPSTSMKAIVTNRAAIAAKYGNPGAGAAIEAALQRQIATDKIRGIETVIFDIADPAQMGALGAAAVIGAKDDRGAKVAVDAIFKAHMPDYIMLLDGPDVVPHVALNRIPGVIDADTTTDSDLPYASSTAFSRQASAYLAVTRVVGRLPAARGETDEKKLIELLDAASRHEPRPETDFASYFAITADKWTASTRMSLGNVFGGHEALFVSPKDCHTGIDTALSNAAHLINCHGASGDWRFYGESGGAFPVAMQSPGFAAATVGTGAVVAMECCYGAQLYDYRMSGSHAPICLTYLSKGACAVMGSTNIAYGPASENGQADYMAQYFLQEVLKGASTGRALLQARQLFVQNQLMSNNFNMKTLAQFVLLGDPSLHPVRAETPAIAGAAVAAVLLEDDSIQVDPAGSRRHRRAALDSEGKALASTASKLGRATKKASSAAKSFIDGARKRGFGGPAKIFDVTGGASFRATAKAFGQERQVAIVMDETKRKDDANREIFTSWRVIVGHIEGDRVFSIEECESR